MKAEKEFDLVRFIRHLEARNIEYLLVGRWAVVLYGAPLLTADYDFWISPKQKVAVLRWLKEEEFEIPPRARWKKPILSVYCGPEKIDLLFYRQIVNQELRRITFEECVSRSTILKEPRGTFFVRVPSIDDLIALKKIQRKHPEDALKDSTDVRFLQAIRRDLK